MIIGVPKEIKNNECRVGLTPKSVSVLSKNNKVFVEKDAGIAIGFSNQAYIESGAEILDTASDIYDGSELIVKVKNHYQKKINFYHLKIYFSPTFISLVIKKMQKT